MFASCSFLTTAILIPLTHALFSFNSTFSSNGITIKNQTFNGTIPLHTLSAACATAYASPVNCSTSLMFVGSDLVYYSKMSPSIPTSAYETLYKDVCTKQCYTSLSLWRTALVGSCSHDFDNLFPGVYSAYTDPGTYLLVPGAGADVDQFVLAHRDEEHVWLDWIYWRKCLRDLNSASYCTLTEPDTDLAIWPSIEASRYSHLTKEEAAERNRTFCSNATCFIQSELLNFITTKTFQGENCTLSQVNTVILDVCPDLNINASFPFLQLGHMYPFDDANKTYSSSATSASSQDTGGITDLSTANSTMTSRSSAMPTMTLHLACFMAVAGLSLLL